MILYARRFSAVKRECGKTQSGYNHSRAERGAGEWNGGDTCRIYRGKPGSKDTEWKRDPVRVTWAKKFRSDVSLLSFGD